MLPTPTRPLTKATLSEVAVANQTDIPEILSREEAVARGLAIYFDGGFSCRSGHTGWRYVANNVCVECNRSRKKNWAKNNPDKIRKWAADNSEKVKEINRRCYRNNIEKRKDNTKRCRANNIDYYSDYRKRYREEKADLIRALNTKRRAAKRGAPGKYTPEDIANIVKAQRNKCAYCRCSLARAKRHIDHIVPLSRGGTNWPSNIQLTCDKCNLSKNSKHPVDFARERGLLV